MLRPSSSPSSAFLALAMLGLAAAGCTHPIEDGIWVLSQEPGTATLDTCGLLAQDGSIGEGLLRVSGIDVRYGVGMPGLGTPVSMLGRTVSPAHGGPDLFALEGTLNNEPFPLAGAACVVYFGQVHLQATVVGDHDFTCQLQGHYKLDPSADPGCRVTCDYSVGCRGVWLRSP